MNKKDIFAVPGRAMLKQLPAPQYEYKSSYDHINRKVKCNECRMIDHMMLSSVSEIRAKPPYEYWLARFNEVICDGTGDNHTIRVKPHHTGNGKPKGIFAGTLTMSPKWETNEEEMCEAIKKIMRQKTTPVKRYVWYLEYTKEDVPHIHFIYETEKGGRITQQTFKRQWKWWDESTPCGSGHVGGYHKHCAKEDDYLEYISKDKGRHENKWTT